MEASSRSIITRCQFGLESCAVDTANFISFAAKEKAAASVMTAPEENSKLPVFCRVSTPSPFNAECFRPALFLTKISSAGTPTLGIAVPSENNPSKPGLTVHSPPAWSDESLQDFTLIRLKSLYYSAPSIRFAALIREIRDAIPLPVFCSM
jgi:hypothetical protein